jgi:glucuronate isomerase
MRPFLDEDFLLTTPAARHLYHDFAEGMPIIDYHCHLSPPEIAENIRLRNLGHLLLGGDHYKWRAMSAEGYDNEFIRTSGDFERFMAYAKTMPRLIGNPLYHWTHLELKRVFGIEDVLNADTAQSIWDRANEMLRSEEFRARRLIEKFNVKMLCTTDDPADVLECHAALARDPSFHVKVLPAFRPERALNAGREDFPAYIGWLSEVSDIEIGCAEDVIRALEERIDFFHLAGCRLSDHALDTVPFAETDMAKADAAFFAGMHRRSVDPEHLEHYRTAILVALGGMYHARGWAQQYHIGAMRNASTRMFRRFGPDTGFDAIEDAPFAGKLARLLDAQEARGALPRAILYTLNPAANTALAAVAGCFQGGVPGKIQFGSAWWFSDHREGMRAQLKALAGVGLLGRFIGMLTDSRSFVSYPRHEYFRRILCDLVGEWVENGEYPADDGALKALIQGICYENAREYFGVAL